MKLGNHAQFKFTRRLNNRRLGKNNPNFGMPIPGPLSVVEKAHKDRRRARRKVIISQRIDSLTDKLRIEQSTLKVWEMGSNSPNAPEAEKKHAADMLNKFRAIVAFTSSAISRAKVQLEAVTA